jgi:transposase
MNGPACEGCRERDQRIAALEKRVADLEAKLRQFLGRNSSNSSTPPSANPPGAPTPTTKQPTGRKRGGQPGHAAQNSVRLPADMVTKTRDFLPQVCECCGNPLAAEAGANDPPPLWHQVIELPEVLIQVTEYLGHARTCGHCGHLTQATIPADLRAHRFGTRLTAAISSFTGMFHVSKRDTKHIVQGIFGAPISVGSVSAAERETSEALAAAYGEAQQACHEAPVNNVDETSWKLGKQLIWLWAAVSKVCTFFLIHRKRGAEALSAVFTKAFAGITISDRWVVYNRLPVRLRQLCWAHLIRDFQAMFETNGPGQKIGEDLLCFAEDIFTFWYRVRDGTLKRSTFRQYVNEQRPWLRERLAEGAACGCAKTAALCRNLLNLEPALWTFARVEGVEPTNNAAERALRKAVLWRKRSFGCKGEVGCRFVERMLTVTQTLQQHQRPVLKFLVASLQALRQGRPAPPLLAATD